MSVSRADANGAGSGSSAVAAPTTTDRAAPGKAAPKPGLADGPNTTWSTARKGQVQVAEGSARRGSIDFTKINVALNEVVFAEFRFVAANNEYATNPNHEPTKAKYEEANRKYKIAQTDLGLAIEDQTEKAGDSSLYRRGHGLKNCGEVRQREQKILDCAASPHLKDHLEQAILENRSLRAPRELGALSAKMQETNHKLNPAQTREAAFIIADATEAVTGKREGDGDLPPEQVTKNKLDRLTKLLATVTTRVDAVTGKAQKFDPGLYDQVAGKIKAEMGPLDEASNQSFDAIVASHRPVDAELNFGP